MTVNSDISLNANLFAASAIPPETTAFNEKLINIMKGAPKWYEVPILFPLSPRLPQRRILAIRCAKLTSLS